MCSWHPCWMDAEHTIQHIKHDFSSLGCRPAWIDETINWTVEWVEELKLTTGNPCNTMYAWPIKPKETAVKNWTSRLLWVKPTFRCMIEYSQTDLVNEGPMESHPRLSAGHEEHLCTKVYPRRWSKGRWDFVWNIEVSSPRSSPCSL